MAERFVLQPPAARAALVRGMAQMSRLLRPTLGPVARTVAVAPIVGHDPPEVLDSAATIARRTLALSDPFESMGAMIVRHLVWRVFERVGDGAATAAVLAQALVEQANTYVAAGGNPVLLKRGVDRGLAVALAELRRQARPIDEPAELAALLAGSLHDPALATMVARIVDSVGPDGSIQFEDAPGSETTYEYLDGLRWNEGYLSAFLVPTGQPSARLLNPRVLVTDHYLETADQLLPALEACLASGSRSLLVVAPEVRDSAIALLILNRERGTLDGALAVRAPLIGTQRTRALEDIAVATGARCIHQELQESLANLTVDDLGQARQAWATSSAFAILGGQGSKPAIRQRIAEAKHELQATDPTDEYTRYKIRERIGKLAGQAAVIRVGAPTTAARTELERRLEAAVATARAALQDGVVPGGGAALLACIPPIEALPLTGDESVGATLLAHALAEPMRTLTRNAGLDPAWIVHQSRQQGPARVFDLLHHQWVDPWQAGLLDPLAVTLAALETGVSAATMALTADVLVHRRHPPASVEP
jgi:chaperonin GroEL